MAILDPSQISLIPSVYEIITDLIIGGGTAPSSGSSSEQSSLPWPDQSIGINILALLHLFFSKFSFQSPPDGSPRPKAA